MPSSSSDDLGERVGPDIDAEVLRRKAGRRSEVSPASAVRWHETFVQEVRIRAEPTGGDQRSHAIEAQAELIRQIYKAAQP